jgi:hypothetical protein
MRFDPIGSRATFDNGSFVSEEVVLRNSRRAQAMEQGLPPTASPRAKRDGISVLLLVACVAAYGLAVLFLLAKWRLWGSPGFLLSEPVTGAASFWFWRTAMLLLTVVGAALIFLGFWLGADWPWSREFTWAMWGLALAWAVLYRVETRCWPSEFGTTFSWGRVGGGWNSWGIIKDELVNPMCGTGLIALTVIGALAGWGTQRRVWGPRASASRPRRKWSRPAPERRKQGTKTSPDSSERDSSS